MGITTLVFLFINFFKLSSPLINYWDLCRLKFLAPDIFTAFAVAEKLYLE